MVSRAYRAWTDAGLTRIGLHECRHTFITSMIHAGLKRQSRVCPGRAHHAHLCKYGHMFAGHEDAAGALLDSFYSGAAAKVVSLPARRAA